MNPDNDDGTGPFGGLRLDRKKMEEERLARAARKRRIAEVSDPTDEKSSRQRLKIDDSLSSDTRAKSYEKLSAVCKGQADKLPFLDGAIRRTWAAGHARQSDDIAIEDLLDKDQLEMAIFASFQWDEEWILRKIDRSRTRIMFIAYAPASEQAKSEIRANAPTNLRFCFPPMAGPGAMHAKLQLLKFPQHMRLVVPTGNLTPYDWGETGVMENMSFVIDLPKLDDPALHTPTEFSKELNRYLKAMTLDPSLVRSLVNYDFSRTNGLAFVHTMPGSHGEDVIGSTGFCGLARAVQSLGLSTDEKIDVDVVCSSLGSLTDSFLSVIYRACQGDLGIKQSYGAPVPAKKQAVQSAELIKYLRVHFPTQETVLKSRGGYRVSLHEVLPHGRGKKENVANRFSWTYSLTSLRRQSAGTICFSKKWWQPAKFSKEVMRDTRSTRPGLLLHTKAILVRRAGNDDSPAAWAYVGSANLSESAWGRVAKAKGQDGGARLYCRNWECGVLVPARKRTNMSENQGQSVNGLGGGPFFSEDTAIPLPALIPGEPYTKSGDGSHPWFMDEQ